MSNIFKGTHLQYGGVTHTTLWYIYISSYKWSAKSLEHIKRYHKIGFDAQKSCWWKNTGLEKFLFVCHMTWLLGSSLNSGLNSVFVAQIQSKVEYWIFILKIQNYIIVCDEK